MLWQHLNDFSIALVEMHFEMHFGAYETNSVSDNQTERGKIM